MAFVEKTHFFLQMAHLLETTKDIKRIMYYLGFTTPIVVLCKYLQKYLQKLNL